MSYSKKLFKPKEEIVINLPSKSQDTEVICSEEEKQDKPTTSSNNQLYNNIKDIVSNNKPKRKSKVYFTTSRGVTKINIDNLAFKPSRSALLQSKKFEAIYLQELESILYSQREEVEIDKLLPLVTIFSSINKKNYPIKVVSANYKKMLYRICSVLNDFINKNYTVIKSIYESFNSIKDTEEEARNS